MKVKRNGKGNVKDHHNTTQRGIVSELKAGQQCLVSQAKGDTKAIQAQDTLLELVSQYNIFTG